ncbi:MAG: hypothetical protein AAF399_18455, partial [Bacteroidota bacterium]
KDNYEVWRLIYALKWQTNTYDPTEYEAIKDVVMQTFEKLGYADPRAETELLFMFLDGAATALILHEPANKKEVLAALKKKYHL